MGDDLIDGRLGDDVFVASKGNDEIRVGGNSVSQFNEALNISEKAREASTEALEAHGLKKLIGLHRSDLRQKWRRS